MKRILIFSLLMLFINFFTNCFLDSDSGSESTPTTGTISVKATYNGSLEDIEKPGTKQIYVYLYKTLTASAQDAPDYQACTTDAAAIGEECTITINDIAPADYNAVVFYDYKKHNQNTAGNGDRYIIYDSTQYVSEADAVTVEAGSTDTLTIDFDDSYSLNSDGAYD